MNKTVRTIAKNASYLMVSQVSTWVLTLGIMIFLTRYLGANGVGQIHLANSIWTMMGIIITFGMDTLLVKEIARKPEIASELFGGTLLLRTILYGITFLGVTLYTSLAGYEIETVYVILIVGLAHLLSQYAYATRAVLQGLERMEFLVLGDVLSRAFTAAATVGLLLLGYGVIPVVALGIISSLIQLLIVLYYLLKIYPLRLSLHFKQMTWMLKTSYQYFLVMVFLVFYSQIDIIIISLLVNEQGVGWYGAADQLFGTFLFVPTIFITAIFPALSRMYANESDALPRMMRKSFNLMLLISIPVGLGVMIVATPLIVLLFGEDFRNSGPVLAVMGVVLIITYLNMLLGQFLISIDRQKSWTWVMAAAFFATIPLDILLVPWCQARFGNGAVGGALAFIVTEAGMLAAALFLLPKSSFDFSNLRFGMQTILAGLVMVGVTWWVREYFIAVPVMVGGLSYVGMILLLRVIPPEDWGLMKELGQGILTKLGRGKAPAPNLE
jgi:O-antigen/teichoic acid export membrane protein